jgi:hypothetical protein
MKTLIHPVQHLSRSLASPLNRAALPLFFALAFLPAILCLTLPAFSVTNPVAALGPVIAAFWLAGSLREIRLHFAVLGTVVTALLWAANWIMMAGGHCCQTLGH